MIKLESIITFKIFSQLLVCIISCRICIR